jgi:hypothetical protein
LSNGWEPIAALPAAQARMDDDPSVRLAILIPDRETPHRASPDLLWG